MDLAATAERAYARWVPAGVRARVCVRVWLRVCVRCARACVRACMRGLIWVWAAKRWLAVWVDRVAGSRGCDG